ncbi:MAG: Na+/H+ antiporter NhaA [Planctomycetota bacterium]|nr:Na+/H+ antiporter NhaA [Planctomycetota bacterium]
MVTSKAFKEFFSSERAGAFLLMIATAISLTLANTGFGEPIQHFLHTAFLGLPVEAWVNDGLMVIFFLMIGLELERETYVGELSSWKNASLPIVAAVGGMCVPALVHFLFNMGTGTQRGAGIPMATDIAFSLGVLALFSKKVPYSLKIFLTALAIADDLGAIVVIAVFYTKELSLAYLFGALGIFAFLCCLNGLRVMKLWPYLVGGLAMWWFFLQSGVHATIGGVLLAFAIPFAKRYEDCISHQLQHRLHYPVALGILPIFALVNTCIPLHGDWHWQLLKPNSLGIYLGLVLGKPLGIALFCFLAIQLRLGRMPDGLRFTHLVGAGLLAGIGFTMSIFISTLAFEDSEVVNLSQIAVLLASTTSAILGGIWFVTMVPNSLEPDSLQDAKGDTAQAIERAAV